MSIDLSRISQWMFNVATQLNISYNLSLKGKYLRKRKQDPSGNKLWPSRTILVVFAVLALLALLAGLAVMALLTVN